MRKEAERATGARGVGTKTTKGPIVMYKEGRNTNCKDSL